MNLSITINQEDLKLLVLKEISRISGIDSLEMKDVKIETKSNQNYKSEWESGAGFRATINKEI